MKRLRILVLMHEDLVPPDEVNDYDLKTVEWRTEYDVVSTLKKLATRCTRWEPRAISA